MLVGFRVLCVVAMSVHQHCVENNYTGVYGCAGVCGIELVFLVGLCINRQPIATDRQNSLRIALRTTAAE